MDDAVLDAGWDSVRQRAELLRGDAPVERLTKAEKADIVGRLRWDVLLGRKLFLTYAQLLDGAVFAALPPEELLDLLALRAVDGGGTLPVRVTARDSDLGGQLSAMLSAGFLFSSLSVPRADCRRLSAALAERSAARPGEAQRLVADGGPAQAARRILLETGVLPDHLVHRTARRWEQWLALVGAGQLEVGPLSRVDAAALRPVDDAPEPEGAGGRAVLAGWLGGTYDVGGTPNRGRIYIALDELGLTGDAADERDADLLREAIDKAYYRAIASGEGCQLRVRAVRPGVRRGQARKADPARVVLMPEHFERRLGLMPVDTWRRFTDEVEEQLGVWWTRHEPSALQEVGTLLAARTAAPPARAEASPRLTRVRGAPRRAGGQGLETLANGAANVLTTTALGGSSVLSAFAAGSAGHALPELLIATGAFAAARLNTDRVTARLTGRYDLVELEPRPPHG